MILRVPFYLMLLVVMLLTSAAGVRSAQAADVVDRVRLTRGTENGEVTDMTPLDVTLNKGGPGTRKVPLNEIKAILFEGEPTELAQARVSVTNGAFAKAQQQLD